MSFPTILTFGSLGCPSRNASLDKRPRMECTTYTALHSFKHLQPQGTRWQKLRIKRGRIAARRKSCLKAKARQPRHLLFLVLALLLIGKGQRIKIEPFKPPAARNVKCSTYVAETACDISFPTNSDMPVTKNDAGYPTPLTSNFSNDIRACRFIVISACMTRGAKTPRDGKGHMSGIPANERNCVSSSSQSPSFSVTATRPLLRPSSTSQAPTRTAVADSTTTTCTTSGSSSTTKTSSSSNTPTPASSDEFTTQDTLIISHTATGVPSGGPSFSPPIRNIDEQALHIVGEGNEASSVSSGEEEAEFVQASHDTDIERLQPQGHLVESGFFFISNSARSHQNSFDNLSPTNFSGLRPAANGVTSPVVNQDAIESSIPEENFLLTRNQDQVSYHAYNRANGSRFMATPGPEIERLLQSDSYCPIVTHVDRGQRFRDLEILCNSVDDTMKADTPGNEEREVKF